MAIIDEALRDARLGTTRLVLLLGEPGIGKTRVAEETAARAAVKGFSIAWAGCVEGDFAPALWPWAQILRAVGDDSSLAVDAATTEGFADVARFPVYTRVLEALERAVAQRGALLVVIDDLHWADDDSVRLLTFSAVHLRHVPIAFLVTFRPHEIAREHLATLIRAGVGIELEGLAAGEVAQLVAAMTGSQPGAEVADQLRARCGGNPLFVRELTRLLDARPGTAPNDLPIPGGVRAVLDRRLARVPQPVAELLQALAVLGSTATLSLLSKLTDVAPDELLGRLDVARASGVIETSATEAGFTHALVRDAVYESTAMSRRVALHERAARLLENGDGDDRWAAVATHWLRSGRDPARAAIASRQAAHRARQLLAFMDAAAHLGRAVTSLIAADADESEVVDVMLDQADMTLRAGQATEARAIFLAVAARARRRGRTDELARAALGLGAGLAGFEVALRDADQVALLEEALAGLQTETSALRALVLARLAVASFYASPRRHDPFVLATEAVRVARECNDERAIGYALSALCDAIAGPQHSEERLRHATEIVAIGTRCDPAIELLGRRLRLRALLELGDLRAVDVEIASFGAVADRLRQPLYSWYPPLWRGMRALTRGQFDDVARGVAEAAAIGAAAESENATMLTITLDMWRALFAGEPAPDFPQSILDRYADMVSTMASLAIGVAFTAFKQGNLGEAARLYELFAHDDFVRVGGDAEELLNLSNFADIAIALDDRERLAVLYNRLKPFEDRCLVDGIGGAWVGPVHASLARIAHALDRVADAHAHISAARAMLEKADAPLVALFVEQLGIQLDAPRQNRAVIDRPAAADRHDARFHSDGETWQLRWGHEQLTMRDAKGLRDLAYLLARPAIDVHVSELVGVDTAMGGGDLGEVLDRTAREAYRRRLSDLDADLAEAEAHNDRGRAERVRVERDFLVAELSAAVGLGGRIRRAGGGTERARKAVAGRIKQALDRIARDAPSLGRHLRNSVKTGTFCSYRPEGRVDWQL